MVVKIRYALVAVTAVFDSRASENKDPPPPHPQLAFNRDDDGNVHCGKSKKKKPRSHHAQKIPKNVFFFFFVKHIHVDLTQVTVQVLDDVRVLLPVQHRHGQRVVLPGADAGVSRVDGHRQQVCHKVKGKGDADHLCGFKC